MKAQCNSFSLNKWKSLMKSITWKSSKQTLHTNTPQLVLSGCLGCCNVLISQDSGCPSPWYFRNLLKEWEIMNRAFKAHPRLDKVLFPAHYEICWILAHTMRAYEIIVLLTPISFLRSTKTAITVGHLNMQCLQSVDNPGR